jgi:hypothetical protein
MNWSSRTARYRYLIMVLMMGVAVLPNGNALLLLDAPGLPTKSMMTVVVSQ